MNAKQKQTAEDFWKEYFYMTTDTPDYHTFIAFCENLTETSSQLKPLVMQKIADGLIAELDNYLLDAKNCEEIKSLKYKTDLDFTSLLFRVIAKRIIEKYLSNFSA